MRSWLTVLSLASATTFAWLSLSVSSSATSPMSVEDELPRSATLVFRRSANTPEAAIPVSIMLRARGIAVIPAAVKAGAFYRGLGVLSGRGADPELWTPPAAFSFEGALPLDLEADTLDFVLVAQTARGLEYLTHGRFGPAMLYHILPGPLGEDTSVRINADVLAYIQFGDYFAGVTVEDWQVTEMRSINALLYGHPYPNYDIIRGAGFFHLPPAARDWRDALAAYFRQMS